MYLAESVVSISDESCKYPFRLWKTQNRTTSRYTQDDAIAAKTWQSQEMAILSTAVNFIDSCFDPTSELSHVPRELTT